jgi:hypothetical protein
MKIKKKIKFNLNFIWTYENTPELNDIARYY